MTTWRERLADPAPITVEDVERAHSWATCAVGEQRTLHPQVVWVYGGGLGLTPRDEQLEALGCQFFRQIAVDLNRPPGVEISNVLDRIEDRVLQLKRDA